MEDSNQQRTTSLGFAGFEPLQGSSPRSSRDSLSRCTETWGRVPAPGWRWPQSGISEAQQPAEERPWRSGRALPTAGRSSSPAPETHGPPRASGRAEAAAELSALFTFLFLSLVQLKKPGRPHQLGRSAHAPLQPPARPWKPPPSGTFGAGTQSRGAGAGPEGDTRGTLRMMAAAVAGTCGRGAAVGEEADSGNGRCFPKGSVKGREWKGVWVPLCSDGRLRPPRPPPWAGAAAPLCPVRALLRSLGGGLGPVGLGRREPRPRPRRLPKALGCCVSLGCPVLGGGRNWTELGELRGAAGCVSVCTRRGSASRSRGNPWEIHQESTEYKHARTPSFIQSSPLVLASSVCCEGIPK